MLQEYPREDIFESDLSPVAGACVHLNSCEECNLNQFSIHAM